MAALLRLSAFVLLRLIAGSSSARRWRGRAKAGSAPIRDANKAEADIAEIGARGEGERGRICFTSRCKAGPQGGHVIVAIDRTVLDAGSELQASRAGGWPGTVVHMQVVSGGREHPVRGPRRSGRLSRRSEIPYAISLWRTAVEARELRHATTLGRRATNASMPSAALPKFARHRCDLHHGAAGCGTNTG
jgi:hypothetical protein